jgi:uncharacterized protein
MRVTSEMENTKADDPKARPRSRRGFALLDPKQVRKLASRGGRAAHECGTAHEFTREEAQVAGRKGGLASARRRAAK